MRQSTALLIAAALFTGCDRDKDASTDDTDNTDSAHHTDGTTEAGPTWYQDVRPVVFDACASCHNGEGIGPGDFQTYAGAFEGRDLISAYLAGGLMPLPSADPECRPYKGHERMRLSDEDRAMLIDWASGDALEGDAETATEAEIFSGVLADADVIMPMPFEHTITPDDDGGEYFCMTPENPFDEPTYVTGFDVELGNQEVVHHMCLFVDFRGNAGESYGVDDTSEGFQCADPIIEDDWLPLHCWTPGMEPVEFPEDMGLFVAPQYQLVLQMHYFVEGDAPQTDLSTYKFRTQPSVSREVWMEIDGPEDFQIPAGDSEHSDHAYWRNNDTDYEILGAFPHMHKLGSGYHSWIEAPDGTEDCLVQGEYDFDHQMTYMLEEPLDFPKGSKIGVECTWDNSASNPDQPSDPPQDVTWGEGTTEEMCYLLYYLAEKE